MPNLRNFSGCSTGYWTDSMSSRLTVSRPPMSSHRTLGTSTTATSRRAEGVAGTESESEVVHGNTKGIQDLGIDGVLIKIDEIHLLTNLLHGSLGAERGNIGTDVTVSLRGDLLEINTLGELHVLGVDLEDLETARRVGNTDVNLTIETTETTKSGIDRVGPVGGGHDDNVAAGLHAVHESQKLGNDTALDFSVGLVTLGGDRVDLVNEDDRGRVLLGFLERFSEVGFRFTGHLGHDFGSVDKEEESTSLVGNSSGHKGLSGSGRSVLDDRQNEAPDGLKRCDLPARYRGVVGHQCS